MQNILRIFLVLAVSAFLTKAAEEAVVTEGKINVRGQPSLGGEVVGQLSKGDKVTILERVKVEKPKQGDPAEWAKISLPEKTPVWVFSPFVKDGAVAASRLNLRAGPGENYSVIGRLEKGAPVKTVRTIEEWMEIEAPKDAYAFIDASLVKSSGAAPPVATTATAGGAAAIPTPSPATPPTTGTATATGTGSRGALAPPATTEGSKTPGITNTVAAATPPPPREQPALEPATTSPAVPPPTSDTTTAAATPAPTAAATAPATTQALPQVAPAIPAQAESAPGKRIVRRQGVVRPTRSIQAPTWYELVDSESKVTINYLHEEKMGISLKEYRGQKVVVSGEEAIDPRWPKTPILELETLDIAP